MELTIAEKYKAALDALPTERQLEPLWEHPGFEAEISYAPAPYREIILAFPDGSVFDYYDRWALSRTDWADRDKSIIGWGTRPSRRELRQVYAPTGSATGTRTGVSQP
jgi:hypothetical protein